MPSDGRAVPAGRARSTIATAARGVVCGLIVAGALSTQALAGLSEGLAAYDRGDYATALRELAPAAAAGAPFAQYDLARMYFSGEGVPRDSAAGLKWLRQAAAAGIGLAQYQLGACYEWGISVAQNYGEAASWYRRAADRGVAAAQYRLGLFYLNGLGVTRDPVAAHLWLNLAAARLPPGEPRNAVARLRESVAANMTPAQVAAAQSAAGKWKPIEDSGPVTDAPNGSAGR